MFYALGKTILFYLEEHYCIILRMLHERRNCCVKWRMLAGNDRSFAECLLSLLNFKRGETREKSRL